MLSTEPVEPFRRLETTSPLGTDDIVELATMVAIEAYLVLAVLSLGLLISLRALWRFVVSRLEVRRTGSVPMPSAARQPV